MHFIKSFMHCWTKWNKEKSQTPRLHFYFTHFAFFFLLSSHLSFCLSLFHEQGAHDNENLWKTFSPFPDFQCTNTETSRDKVTNRRKCSNGIYIHCIFYCIHFIPFLSLPLHPILFYIIYKVLLPLCPFTQKHAGKSSWKWKWME
jgi:hypothetical protein